ncbi:MAG: DEAD/DEAH box helicase family protein [Chromatiaceae bacterium]|nr:DEAD/DEAH box helicase family protein [Chromatiaceae bacterium]
MELQLMKSLNFEFLREDYPDLAALGGFAEAYAHTDPDSAAVKLRTFIERLIYGIYDSLDLAIPPKAMVGELTFNRLFQDSVPQAVRLKISAIADHGNKAAHGKSVTQQTALWLLKEAHELGCWYVITVSGCDRKDCPEYREPPAGGVAADSKAKLKQEKKELKQELVQKEAELDAMLAKLAAAKERARAFDEPQLSDRPMDYLEAPASMRRTSSREIDFSISESRESVAEFKAQQFAEAGRRASDELEFSEEATRQWMIDKNLVDAGWDVAANGDNTQEVTQEEEVIEQPTNTGLGYADYVLWDVNNKPLAVIEAKKTAVSAEKGQTQARLYADGLQKMHGQRPAIFYTNGIDIWIWDDLGGYPPRKIHGFYSKDSLQYLIFQREQKIELSGLMPKGEIINRPYQHEAVRRVAERFTSRRRKALVVQATGTGKTRVAISLAELLIRARWAKRVLFLCDRRELRKQAKDAFAEFVPGEPLTVVGAATAKNREKRIYLATYPAMTKVFQSFDVGFFDLIIADESHRSIYNVYGDLFRYFDCLQLGLTATPVEFVARNTYSLFECADQNPTAYYPFELAVEQDYLVPFEVDEFTTGFLRKGIKYNQMTEEQQKEVEEGNLDPDSLNHEVKDVDKNVYNKDTGRHILRNLMENGIRDGDGQRIGKSIIFARGHEHAVFLRNLFDEMYPEYGGRLCQVIDNYDPRAEQLIDDFKDPNNELTIAISVDMLDTGIDVPEVVNLVFAKPIYSKVKFWQMIGRGTRLCKDLFGEGRHKTKFLIFDHWGNFDYFDFHYQHIEPTVSKSLMQRVFEAHVELAEAALTAAEPEIFDMVIAQVANDLASLPEESISVREKWRQKREVSKLEVLHAFAPATVGVLRNEMAPLMQWVNVRGYTEAYELDLLIARMQQDLLTGGARIADYRINLLDRVNALQMHLNPVREKAELIKEVRSEAYWKDLSVQALEQARTGLRDIIHHRQKGIRPGSQAQFIDIAENPDEIEHRRRPTSIPEVEMKAYRQQVEASLQALFDTDPTLKKIHAGEDVSEDELRALTSLILTQNPGINEDILAEFFGKTAESLLATIRRIVGMDAEAVEGRFTEFVNEHPLTAKQLRFLQLLQSHIARYGAIELERLYEAPFTTLDAEGLDGVFPGEEGDEIVSIIKGFLVTDPTETPEA